VALLRAKAAIGKLSGDNSDIQAGINIVLKALEAPIRQIAENAEGYRSDRSVAAKGNPARRVRPRSNDECLAPRDRFEQERGLHVAEKAAIVGMWPPVDVRPSGQRFA